MSTRRTPRRLVAPLISLAAVLGVAGCAEKKRTEIVLGLATDLNAPVPLASVHLQVLRLPEDVPIGEQSLTISGNINNVYGLPGTYAVYSPSGSPDRVRVSVLAQDNTGATVVKRTAVLSLVPERTLFARLGILTACMNKSDCPAGETCILGRCAPEEIDSKRLPDYHPGMENEIACAESQTFIDTSTKLPLKVVGTSCGSGTCQEGVCLGPAAADGGAADGFGGDGGAGAIAIPSLGGGFDYHQGSYSLGWSFTANAAVQITALGFYDDLEDGLTESHPVGIYDKTSQVLLASVTVSPTAPLSGYFRYAPLATPLALSAGHTYVAMAAVGTERYLAFNAIDPAWTVDPAITYAGGAVNYGNTSSGTLLFPDTFTTGSGDFGPNIQLSRP